MGWITELALAACLVIITGGVTTFWMVKKFHQLDQQDGDKKLDGFVERLETLEKRVNDVQEVVLSLDDRMKVSGDQAQNRV
jgi:hypothetical protein